MSRIPLRDHNSHIVDIQDRGLLQAWSSAFCNHISKQCTKDPRLCSMLHLHCPTPELATPPVVSHTVSSSHAPITPSATFPSPLPPNGGSSDPPPPPQSTPTMTNHVAPTSSPPFTRQIMTHKPGSNSGGPGSSNAGTSHIITTTVTATSSIYEYSGQVPHPPEGTLPSSTTSDRASSLPSSSLSSNSRRLPLGAIIGVTLAVVITLLLLGLWWWRRRLRRARSWGKLGWSDAYQWKLLGLLRSVSQQCSPKSTTIN